jgi:hypothetical protein
MRTWSYGTLCWSWLFGKFWKKSCLFTQLAFLEGKNWWVSSNLL